MKKLNIFELEKTLDFENPQVLSNQELFTMVSDSLYFSGIDISSCAASKYGYKIADKYCSNTLMKMLYEDKHIDEWCYVTYKSIKKTLKDFSKDKGFKDEENLRIKLLAMESLLNELTSYLRKIGNGEIED